MCQGMLGVDVLEHRLDIVVALLGEDAELFGLLLRGADVGVESALASAAWRSSSHSPSAMQMRLQPLDRVAERPRSGFAGGTVAGRIVGGRMALGAIGEELDQRRAGVGPRALGRPARRGIDRERVIAVDAQAGDAIADRARGEGRALGAGDARRSWRSPTGC